MTKFKKYKSILKVIWQDAAYSNRDRLPRKMPPKQVTFGLFLGETKKAVNIGMNCHLENKKITDCHDTFMVPKKAIEKIIKIGEINE